MANEHLFDDLIVRLLEIMDIFQPYTEISWGVFQEGLLWFSCFVKQFFLVPDIWLVINAQI